MRGVVDSHQGVGWGDTGLVLSHSSFFLICAFVFWYIMSCLFFKRVEHDSCCVSFFLSYLFSLSLVALSRNYWGIEIVVSVM